MTTVGQLFPSRFLKAEDDFEEGETKTLTIDRWEQEELGRGQNKETKPVLYFKEINKGLVLNKTNAAIIAETLNLGTLEEWVGKQITLFTMEVDSFGDIVRAIRVKAKAKGKPAPAPVKPNGNGIKPQAAPAPAPETPSAPKAKRALKVTPGFDMEGFKANVAQQIPYYADKNGKPDSFHIIGALTKLSIDNLGPDNAEEAFAMLGFHAQAEQDAKQVEREAKQAA